MMIDSANDSRRLPRPLQILCINLDEEVERMAKIRALFGASPDFALDRLPGFLGSTLPHTVFPLLTGAPFLQPGTLGCFLSHIMAWERVAAGDAPVLVIEDDVQPIGLERLFDVRIPPDADLLFVNGRMSDRSEGVPEVLSLRSILPVKANLPPRDASVGGDGYLLFPEGARRLLAAVEKDGVAGHVDWRLFRYGLSPADVAALPGDPWFTKRAILRERGASWGIVTAYRLSARLVDFHESMGSMRLRLDQAVKARDSG